MRAKDAIGKRIVGVKHAVISRDGIRSTVVDYLELEDGTRLITHAHPTDDVPAGDIIVSKQSKN